MDTKGSDIQKRLLSIFKIEAQEHIDSISSGLVELEKAPDAEKQAEIIEMIFRKAHSLKGAARAVNMTDIEAVCQSLESIFAVLKSREMALSQGLFDVLYDAADTLDKLLLFIETEPTESQKTRVKGIIQRLERASSGEPLPKQEELERTKAEGQEVSEHGVLPIPTEERPIFMETVRIPISKLNPILLQAEELLSAKLAANQRTAELLEIHAKLTSWKKEWTKLSPEARTVQRSLLNGKVNLQIHRLLEFLEWNRAFMVSLESQLAEVIKSFEHDKRSLGGIVDNLLNDMKRVLMLPFSSLLEGFPRFVRELSRDHGKEVDLVIHGGEIEIDRRILEEMRDAFIHLIRNCVDHGIEKPEERELKKKRPRGRITVSISQKNGNNVEILLSDDGAGINVDRVRSSALEHRIISQEEAENLDEQEVLSLIFRSGVSTSLIVTDISGRGLGLAIVREKVEKLGGTVSVETHPDEGTTFRIVLPLTLATFRGVLVRERGRLFVFPMTNLERVIRTNEEEIETIENRETIQVNGEILSLVRLGDALEIPRQGSADDPRSRVQVVVLTSSEKRIAFAVDEILNEQEVLVKNLGKRLSRVRNITGATVLGTGTIVPILNVSDLTKSAVRIAASHVKAPVTAEEVKTKKKSILIVEDSITARTLLKNILEAAGYSVKTAVDGIEGLTTLRTEDFDLVVSDVDMPRMNGFDLTAKIRADKRLSELPVILVTALESREDRERGIDVGANAYIVKSSFDQSNLLEVIRRLI